MTIAICGYIALHECAHVPLLTSCHSEDRRRCLASGEFLSHASCTPNSWRIPSSTGHRNSPRRILLCSRQRNLNNNRGASVSDFKDFYLIPKYAKSSTTLVDVCLNLAPVHVLATYVAGPPPHIQVLLLHVPHTHTLGCKLLSADRTREASLSRDNVGMNCS